MRLRAKIKEITGQATRHHVGTIVDGQVKRGEELSDPFWVEIVEFKGAFYLNYLDYDLRKITDSWFEHLADAKESAREQFKIEEQEWKDVSDQQV